MKSVLPLTVCLLTVVAADIARAQAPKTPRERIGYALGAEIGQTFKSQGVDFDVAAFNAAIRDAMAGNRLQMTSSQIQETIMSLNKGGGAAATKPAAPDASTTTAENKRAGDAFLVANRAKPGVQSLPSGLQYKVLHDGAGTMPKLGDTVVVKYRGTTLSGTEFDSSEKHGDGTLTIKVSPDAVIAGWVEALKMMRPGAKWQLYVPSTLAYGDQGVGTDIGPGSTLIFDVELLSVKR